MKKIVIWDFDGTLTYKNCLHHLLLCRKEMAKNSISKLWGVCKLYAQIPIFFILNKISSQRFNRFFYDQMVFDKEEYQYVLDNVITDFFYYHLHEELEQKIKKFRAKGYQQYLVSASPHFLIEAMAERLEMDGAFATHIPTENGTIDGRLATHFIDGAEKATIVKEILQQQSVRRDQILLEVYGNSIYDKDMLALADVAHAVNPSKKLKSLAAQKKWNIINIAKKPHAYTAKWTHFFIILGYPLLKLLTKKTTGIYNIPRSGPALLIANHCSYLDHYFPGLQIAKLLNRKVYFLAKKAHLEDSKFSHKWHYDLGGIAIDRKNFGVSQMKKALEVLERGDILLIYPEGTRSLDGQLKKFKRGFIKIQEMANVPIIPIGFNGTFEMLPKGKIIPQGKASVQYGKPVLPKAINSLQTEEEKIDFFRERIQKLSESNDAHNPLYNRRGWRPQSQRRGTYQPL